MRLDWPLLRRNVSFRKRFCWRSQGVQYGTAVFRSGVFQTREGEAGDLAQAVALVFPRHGGVHEIDLLMD